MGQNEQTFKKSGLIHKMSHIVGLLAPHVLPKTHTIPYLYFVSWMAGGILARGQVRAMGSGGERCGRMTCEPLHPAAKPTDAAVSLSASLILELIRDSEHCLPVRFKKRVTIHDIPGLMKLQVRSYFS